MIFDTHIHLNDEKLYENLDLYLKEAKEVGVSDFLCVGYDLESSKRAIEIANKYNNVYAAIGFIPTEWKKWTTSSIANLEELLKKSSKIVAIGEIGLDYYWEKEENVKKIQKLMFISQIELANKYDLPISIHSRDSIQDTYDILKNYPCVNKGIMHCYSGSIEMSKEFIKLGYKIAFGGVLTFKNAIEIKRILKQTDLKNVVLETDAPYLSPVPHRGKVNEPKFILDTAKFAANLLKINLEELANITYQNSLDILKLN